MRTLYQVTKNNIQVIYEEYDYLVIGNKIELNDGKIVPKNCLNEILVSRFGMVAFCNNIFSAVIMKAKINILLLKLKNGVLK